MRRRQGFTLIELIIVIAILAVLTALAAPRYLAYINDANVSSMKADAKVLYDQVSVAYAEHIGDSSIADAAQTLLTEETKTGDVKPTGKAFNHPEIADALGRKVKKEATDTDPKEYENYDTTFRAYQFNENKVKGRGIKLKNPVNSYYLVLNNTADNFIVVHKEGIKDSKGLYYISNVQDTGAEKDAVGLQ